MNNSSSLESIVAGRLPWVQPQYRKLYLKVVHGNGSRAECMKMQCLECMDADVDGIRNCTSLACAMFAYRPFQANPKRGKPRGRSIASGAKLRDVTA